MSPDRPALQDLTPKDARLCLGVEAFIREQLGADAEGLSVILSFSGGADSQSLALILSCLAPRLKWRLHAAHLDHGLRPESAGEAEAAVAACAAMGLECSVERVDVAALARDQALGLEEAGRRARHAFLNRVRLEQGADILALGHQLNDLAEDVLMRMVRGTGWPGLGGMAAWNREARVLRPLLLTERARLEVLLSAQDATWINDPSNHDRAFLRNRVRHDILPMFVAENPGFLKSVAGLWRLARLDAALYKKMFNESGLWEKATNNCGDSPENIETDAQHAETSLSATLESLVKCGEADSAQRFLPAQVLDMPKAMRLRLYKYVLETLGRGQPLLDSLFKLDRAWTQKHFGSTVQFPGRKTARVERDGLHFFKDHEA